LFVPFPAAAAPPRAAAVRAGFLPVFVVVCANADAFVIASAFAFEIVSVFVSASVFVVVTVYGYRPHASVYGRMRLHCFALCGMLKQRSEEHE